MSNKLTDFYHVIETDIEKAGTEIVVGVKKLETIIEPDLAAFVQLMKPIYDQAKTILTTDVANLIKLGLPIAISGLTTGGIGGAEVAALGYITTNVPAMALQAAKALSQSLVALASSVTPAASIPAAAGIASSSNSATGTGVSQDSAAGSGVAITSQLPVSNIPNAG